MTKDTANFKGSLVNIYKLRGLHPNAKIIGSDGFVDLEHQANDQRHNADGPAHQEWNANGVLEYQSHYLNGYLCITSGAKHDN